MHDLPLSKTIDIEDFSSPALLPYLVEINAHEAVRFGSRPEDVLPDSKQWECAMALRAFDRAGALRKGAMVAGIGAGTEATIFALARRGCLVYPVDRYLHRSVWSDVAPAGMMVNPARYSTLPYPRGRVVPVNCSALSLNLPDCTFDGVFSSGSIEHFGSLEKVAIAAREIGRILKPGGVASIATEFRIDGPPDRPWFDDNVILFTPEMLHQYIVGPSGLELRGGIDCAQSERTFETRHNLVDFLQRVQTIHTLEEKRAVYPNLILYHEGFLFCSIALTLYKPMSFGEEAHVSDSVDADRARAIVAAEDAELAAELEHLQRTPTDGVAAPPVAMGDVQALQAEIGRLHQELERATAWKRTAIMRPVRALYRRFRKRGP
jgi:SAM-dependent methyltransferase